MTDRLSAKTKLYLCTLLSVAFLFACNSSPETSAENPDSGPAGQRLAAGELTRVQQDEEVVVVLQTDDGKGYEWDYVQSDTAILEFVELHAESHDAEGEDDRAPSDYFYVWKAKAPGQTTLTYHYVLPWKSGGTPIKTQEYEVVVE